jgi:gliding motility-associated-like protein
MDGNGTQDSSEMEIAYSRDVKLRYDMDTGKHILCLSSRDSAYCLTKACSAILVNKYLALANVFTPGADGFNDVFRVPFGGHKDYEFQVFNRYGERVFHTTSSSEHWNGRVDNIGAQLPSGSYFYQLFFQEECEEKRTMLTGSITLLR